MNLLKLSRQLALAFLLSTPILSSLPVFAAASPFAFKGASAMALFDTATCKFQIVSGSVNPTSSAVNACKGSFYCRTGASGGACYVKTDDGSSTNWTALGAAGITSLSAVGSSPNANAATLTGTALNLQPASASFPGVVTTGTQTLAGVKTFAENLFVGVGAASQLGPFAGPSIIVNNGNAYSGSGISLISEGGSLVEGFFGTYGAGGYPLVFFGSATNTPVALLTNNASIRQAWGLGTGGFQSQVYGDATGDAAPRNATGHTLSIFNTVADARGFWAAVDESNNVKASVSITGLGSFYGAGMQSQKVTSVADPTAAQDAATKNYVDTNIVGVQSSKSRFTIYDEMFDVAHWTVSGNTVAKDVAGVGITSPGAIRISNTTVTNSGINGYSYMYLGGGVYKLEGRLKVSNLSDGTDTYTLRFGLGNHFAAGDWAAGTYFEYSHALNSGNWVGKTALASSRTSVNSSVAVVADTWVRLRIEINAALTSIEFFVNDVSIGTSTTNLPTTASIVSIAYQHDRTAAAAAANRAVSVDVTTMEAAFTSSR